jgi:hypothetical protein
LQPLPRAQDEAAIGTLLDVDIGGGEERIAHDVAEPTCVLRDAPTALLRMRYIVDGR